MSRVLPARLDIDSDDFYDPAAQNTYSSWSVPYTNLQQYKYVSLLSASIPKSYYMISSGFNTFQVSDGITTVIITVPPGSYSYLSLQTVLLPLLSAAGFGAFTMAFAQAQSKFTFNNATAGLRFIFTDVRSMADTLGFFAGTYTFTAGSLQSVRPINLQLTNVVVIETDLIKARQDSSINQRILHAIPDSAPVLAPVTYQNNNPWDTRQPMENIGQVFRISLVDNANRPLDPQHGANITLLFWPEEKNDASNIQPAN